MGGCTWILRQSLHGAFRAPSSALNKIEKETVKCSLNRVYWASSVALKSFHTDMMESRSQSSKSLTVNVYDSRIEIDLYMYGVCVFVCVCVCVCVPL